MNYLKEHYVKTLKLTLSLDKGDIENIAKENLSKIKKIQYLEYLKFSKIILHLNDTVDFINRNELTFEENP